MLIGDVCKGNSQMAQNADWPHSQAGVGPSGSDLVPLRSESCSQSRVFWVLPGSSGARCGSERQGAPASSGLRGERASHATGKGLGSSGLPSLGLVLGGFGADSRALASYRNKSPQCSGCKQRFVSSAVPAAAERSAVRAGVLAAPQASAWRGWAGPRGSRGLADSPGPSGASASRRAWRGLPRSARGSCGRARPGLRCGRRCSC